jgi:HK97 gp10 family phage protein
MGRVLKTKVGASYGKAAMFKMEGLAELERGLRELPPELAKNILWNAAMQGAEVVRLEMQQQIKARGLIDTGELLEAPVKRREKTETPMIAAWRVGPHEDSFYGWFLEHGTVKMAARPFALPALEASREEAMDKIKEVLTRRLKLAVKRLNRGRR